MPDHRNALRRRARLLADEHYGPLYARLSNRREREVNAAVEAGDTRRAKELLDSYHLNELERRRARYRARLERAAVDHQLLMHGRFANPMTLTQGAAIMTFAELHEVVTLHSWELARRAGNTEYARIDLVGLPRNPYWYH